MQQQQIYPAPPLGIAHPDHLSPLAGEESPQKPKSMLGKFKDKAKKLKNKIKTVKASNQESGTGNQEIDTRSDTDDEVKDSSSDEKTSFEQVPYEQLRSIGALGSEEEKESAAAETHGRDNIASAAELAIPSAKQPLEGAHVDPNSSAFKSEGPPDTLQAVPTEYGNYTNIASDNFENLADTSSHSTEGIPTTTGGSDQFSTNGFEDKDGDRNLLGAPSPANAKSPHSSPGTRNASFPDDIVEPNPSFGKKESGSERSGEKIGVPNFEDYDKEQGIATPPLAESHGGIESAAAPDSEEEIKLDHSKADQGEGRHQIDEDFAKHIYGRSEDDSGAPSPVNAKSPHSSAGIGNAIFPDDIVKPNPSFGNTESESERSGEKIGVPNFEDDDKEQSIATPPLPESHGGIESAAAPDTEEEIKLDDSKADQGEGRYFAKYIYGRSEDGSGVGPHADRPISTRRESPSTREGLDFKGHPVEVSQIKSDEYGEELSDGAKLGEQEIRQHGIAPLQDSLTGSLESRNEGTRASETEGDQHYEEVPTGSIKEELSQHGVVPQEGSSLAAVHDLRLGSENLQSEPQSRELKVEAERDEGRDIPVAERAYDGLSSTKDNPSDAATAAAAGSIGGVAGSSSNKGDPTFKDNLQGDDEGIKESPPEDRDGGNGGQSTVDNVSNFQETASPKIGTRAGHGDGATRKDSHDPDGEDIVFSPSRLTERNQMEQPENTNSHNEGNQGALPNKFTGAWLGLKDSVASKFGYGSPTSTAESGDHFQDDASQHQSGTPESLSDRNADEQQQQPRPMSDKAAGSWVGGLKDNVASKLGYGDVRTPEGTATENRQHAIPHEGDANDRSPGSGVSGRIIELKDALASKLGYGSTSPRKVPEDDLRPRSGVSSTLDEGEGEGGRGTLLGSKDAGASKLSNGDSSTSAATAHAITAPAATATAY